MGITPEASQGTPHTQGRATLTSPAPLKPHTVLKTELWRNGVSCMLTPLASSLKGINTSLPPTPISRGDAMVGVGEEELRANNSNRNRVEPFQLFICQMDSFPALFFLLLQKLKKRGRALMFGE